MTINRLVNMPCIPLLPCAIAFDRRGSPATTSGCVRVPQLPYQPMDRPLREYWRGLAGCHQLIQRAASRTRLDHSQLVRNGVQEYARTRIARRTRALSKTFGGVGHQRTDDHQRPAGTGRKPAVKANSHPPCRASPSARYLQISFASLP